MSYERAKSFVMEHEGFYAHDVDDPGGRTYRGVSARAHPDVWADGEVTDAELDRVYRSYWDSAGCESLPWPLSLAVFDFAFHSGITRAREWLPRIAGDPLDDALTVVAARIRFLRGLAALRPTSQKYLRGWLKRCADLASVCIRENDDVETR